MAAHKLNILVKRVFNPVRLLTLAVLIAILFSAMMAFSVLAAAPAEGTVVEGGGSVSVWYQGADGRHLFISFRAACPWKSTRREQHC